MGLGADAENMARAVCPEEASNRRSDKLGICIFSSHIIYVCGYISTMQSLVGNLFEYSTVM